MAVRARGRGTLPQVRAMRAAGWSLARLAEHWRVGKPTAKRIWGKDRKGGPWTGGTIGGSWPRIYRIPPDARPPRTVRGTSP
jgi:hypothetical protein